MWLFIPSYLYVRESQDWISASKSERESWASRFAQFSSANGKHMQPNYWLKKWKKGSYPRLRYGATLPPSTASHGADWFRALLPGCPANRFLRPVSGSPRMTNAGSGRTPSKSSTTSNRTGSSSKMSEASVQPKIQSPVRVGNLLRKSSGTWNQEVSTSRVTYFPRRTSGHLTSENDSSSLPWPTTTTINRNSRNAIVLEGDAHQNHGKALGLEQVAELHLGILPKEMLDPEEIPAKWKPLWPTAKAGRPDQATHFKRGNKTLAAAEEATQDIWPTTTNMTTGAGRQGREGGANLQTAADTWATTTTRDWKDGASPSSKAPTNALLGRQAPRVIQSGRLDLKTGILGKLFYGTDGGSFPPCRLNPHFTSFLMGFPPGWTMLYGPTTSNNSGPTAMQSYRQPQPCPTSSSGFAQWQQSMEEVVRESLTEFYAKGGKP